MLNVFVVYKNLCHYLFWYHMLLKIYCYNVVKVMLHIISFSCRWPPFAEFRKFSSFHSQDGGIRPGVDPGRGGGALQLYAQVNIHSFSSRRDIKSRARFIAK